MKLHPKILTLISFILTAESAVAQYACGHDAPGVPRELYDQVQDVHNSLDGSELDAIENSPLPFISTTYHDCLNRAFDTYDGVDLQAGSIRACRLRHPGGLSCGDSKSWVYGPRDRVGEGLADWITLFDNDYSINRLDSHRNPHTNDPTVTFWIADGTTTVRFMVNLVTGDQFLLEVESVSPEFLKMLRIDLIPVDENGSAVLEDSSDAGTSRLRVRNVTNQEFGAVWNYHWD